MKNKTDFRIYAKELRKTLDIPMISKSLANKIRKSDIYVSAQNIMLFYPIRYEIDLRDLLKDDKTFFLPKVDGENLFVCPFTENLEKSHFNILEPCSNPVSPDVLDLVIVPALMADKHGYRLGYGGGFYDRFLKQCNAKTIVCIPKELFVEELPHEEFDVPVDEIICM